MPKATKAEIAKINATLPPVKKRGPGRPRKKVIKHRIFQDVAQVVDFIRAEGDRVADINVGEKHTLITTESDNTYYVN